jgi:SUZ domain
MFSPEARLSELSKTIRTPGSSSSTTALSEEGPQASNPEIKQIMKRVPGKSTRDEDDAKSESSQSQVLTREERQAVYEKTRARIFSDYVTQGLEPEKESDAGSESKTRITISADFSFFNAS